MKKVRIFYARHETRIVTLVAAASAALVVLRVFKPFCRWCGGGQLFWEQTSAGATIAQLLVLLLLCEIVAQGLVLVYRQVRKAFIKPLNTQEV